MDSKSMLALAYDLFEQAYESQMRGELESAIDLYRQSIDTHPTAEAYTFLGWTYSFQGKLDDAISECKKAIDIDPDFGNPYNDIGAYLIEKSEYEEAIPWLTKATVAKRYDHYHFAHFNLGRAYLSMLLLNRARGEFEQALEIYPDYEAAQEALSSLKKQIH